MSESPFAVSNPSRITETFTRLKSAGQMAFMPFITVGDPDLATTRHLIRELARRQVDLIEVGFPYSDPIADGPVIQASYTRALNQRVRVADIFQTIATVTAEGEAEGLRIPPLVAMVSYALIYRAGVSKFIQQAQQAGFAGLIVPDLPADEAADLSSHCQTAGLDLIPLLAPTTSAERALRILQSAMGFVYCISVAGTTGARAELPAALHEQLQWLKTQTALPLAVGFGVSRPEQVQPLRGLADGIIVGSALVRYLAAITEEGLAPELAIENAGLFVADMVAATHQVAM